MKRHRADITLVITIIFVIALFFARLFYPEPHLIVTPDFGRSDAFHRSFSTKYLLWERISQGTIALWTSQLNGGTPIIGDAVGAVFPPAIFFLGIFGPVNGYNALLVFSIIIFALGTYTWMRLMRLGPFSAFFAAISLALSGIIIPRMVHAMVIPALSLLPWIMLTTLWFSTSPNLLRFAALATIIALQLLANFPQASMLTLLFAFCYLLAITKKRWLMSSLFFAGSVLLASGIAAIQLIPAWEYYQQSMGRSGFASEVASLFAFRIQNLLGLINPYMLGNPKLGTYPPFWETSGDIFWENSAFIGWIPLLFFFTSCLRFLFSKKKSAQHLTIFFLLVFGVSFLCMLGQKSPIYFIYTMPPFSMFRSPSRFLWIFMYCVMILAAAEFDLLWKKVKYVAPKVLLVTLIAINIVQVWDSWYDYHLIVPASSWLTPPATLSYTGTKDRIFSFGFGSVHNDMFTKNGWQKKEGYDFLRNSLDPNSNVIWHVPQEQVYGGLAMTRPHIIDAMLNASIKSDVTTATMSALGQTLLDITATTYVLSAVPLDEGNLLHRTKITDGNLNVFVFENPTAVKRAYMVGEVIRVKTVAEAQAVFSRDTFDPRASAIIENAIDIEAGHNNPTISLTESDDNTTVTVSVTDNERKQLLVLADTYYPGWSATIDGMETTIYAVNIRNRGIIVGKGDHIITFRYQPESVAMGAIISVCSIIVTAGLMAIHSAVTRARKRNKALLPVLHP